MGFITSDGVWLDRAAYEKAEVEYYTKKYQKQPTKHVATEIAKAREQIVESLKKNFNANDGSDLVSELDKQNGVMRGMCSKLEDMMVQLQNRVDFLETRMNELMHSATKPSEPSNIGTNSVPKPADGGDSDVDLFGSDDEEQLEEAKKVREQVLANYAAKKAKKPAVIAKSSVMLDIKPYDSETDMAELEKGVRKISKDGLVWGASKLVPMAYGINKLTLICVIEDQKVSADDIQEQIEEMEDVQSVEIAAFNKI